MKRVLLAALAWALFASPVLAQWQAPNHSVPVGRGSGTGFTSVGPCLSGVPIVGAGASADPVCSSGGAFTGFANPSASIGLTASNGSATTAMRSDATPALSQSILPNWVGLHTFTATAGGVLVSGSPHIGTGGYQELNGLFATSVDVGAVSASEAENGSLVHLASATGSANLTTAFKRGLSVQVECYIGSASCWGQTIATLIGNGGTKRGGVGLEIDLNSFWGDFSGSPTNPYASNLVLTGQNNDGAGHGGYATCAICIEFGQNASPMWNYGIVLGTGGFQVFNTASLVDFSNAPISYIIGGAHSEGIDFSVGTFSTAAIVLGNNQGITIKDSGGTLRNGLTLNGSNVFVLGDLSHDIQVAPHMRVSGSAPAISSGCGTSGQSITTGSSDTAGEITLGSSGLTNTCTVNWSAAYASKPFCVFQDQNLVNLSFSATASASGFVIGNGSAAGMASHTISWICYAKSGG